MCGEQPRVRNPGSEQACPPPVSPESCVSVGLVTGSRPHFGLGFQPQVGDVARGPVLELALKDWPTEPLKSVLCRANLASFLGSHAARSPW